jgi:hypothetical protein
MLSSRALLLLLLLLSGTTTAVELFQDFAGEFAMSELLEADADMSFLLLLTLVGSLEVLTRALLLLLFALPVRPPTRGRCKEGVDLLPLALAPPLPLLFAVAVAVKSKRFVLLLPGADEGMMT